MNVQRDHVHVEVIIPPKVAVSKLLTGLKAQTSIELFKEFCALKRKPYRDNGFLAKGLCVDTVGVSAEMIHRYVKYQ